MRNPGEVDFPKAGLSASNEYRWKVEPDYPSSLKFERRRFPVNIVRSLTSLPESIRGGTVAIGNFDGVHLGHARIVARLVEMARRVRGPAVVFTFDPHPVRVLCPEKVPPPLTWTERKAELLGELGVDWTIAYPTDEALLELTPEEFFRSIVCDQLRAAAVVEGPNFRFGHNREGTVDTLRELARAEGIEADVVSPYEFEGAMISSSRVRQAIAKGNVESAARMLTRPYRIRGLITHGAKRGAQIGFPTANVGAIDTLLPAEGVYAGRGHALGRSWPAAINIGPNPTFDELGLKVEAHLLGFDGSLYGEPLEIDFLSKLRDVQKFATVEAMKEQLRQDAATALKIASTL